LVNLLHLSLDTILIAASLALALYCFRLLSRFFKGGILEAPIKIIGAFAVLFAGGVALDGIADVFETKSFDFHIFHVVIEIMFIVAILYGIRWIYLAWIKLGSQ